MQSKNKVLIIIGNLILFTGTASFVALQGQISTGTSTANKKTLPTPDPLEELKKDFPGIDYENNRAIDVSGQRMPRISKDICSFLAANSLFTV